MQRQYKEYTIEMYIEKMYNPKSADNVTKYDHYYATDDVERFQLSQHGVRIINSGDEIIIQVCVAASGGGTTIHDTSFVIADDTLSLCCADTVFSLTLPELILRWKTKADDVTAFEIFRHSDGFIVHGEMEITRLDENGRIVWQFSGPDIFTTPTGRDYFRIDGNRIYAANWDNVTFELDAVTGELLAHDGTHAKYFPQSS